jgi:peptidoglycan/xylan/chitin deacetylase (PgdA/CDA1 family)
MFLTTNLAPPSSLDTDRSVENRIGPTVDHVVPTLGERKSPPFKRRALELAQRVLHRSGMTSVYANLKRPSRATILMYHSVARPQDEPSIAPGNRVSEASFEEHCRFLSRHRTVVSLDTFVEALEQGRPIPVRTVVLTFDDGYRDTLEVAAPILARYGLPATVFLATAYVDRGKPQWEDELYSMYRSAEHLPRDPLRRYASAAGELLGVGMDVRELTLEMIREELRPTRELARTTLTWDEVRELDREFPEIELGVHTDEHVDLAALSASRAFAHVRACVHRFREELGRSPAHFAFPYCRIHEEVRRALPSLGLVSAMTTTGVVDTARTDGAFDLQRIEACERLDSIAYWTSGAHPDLSQALFRRA